MLSSCDKNKRTFVKRKSLSWADKLPVQFQSCPGENAAKVAIQSTLCGNSFCTNIWNLEHHIYVDFRGIVVYSCTQFLIRSVVSSSLLYMICIEDYRSQLVRKLHHVKPKHCRNPNFANTARTPDRNMLGFNQTFFKINQTSEVQGHVSWEPD